MNNNDGPRLPRRARKDDPKMIGLWKLGRIIGQGACGRVRIARHSKSGRYAAVKIIPRTSISTNAEEEEEAAKALLAAEREIVVMKLIAHPHVLELYDVWTTSSYLYLILEYAPGGELFNHLCSHKLTLSSARRYFAQIVSAVDYCHKFNIVHRDLKPENILLDEQDNIKVADFGMATWHHATEDALLDTACGSPHYAAPEVVSCEAYVGVSADIWSLGVVLFTLLANRLPFDHEDLGSLLGLIKRGTYTMPANIDADAKDLIDLMLQVDVHRRITMPDILTHAFLSTHSLPPTPSLPTFDSINKPLLSVAHIDPHILTNLRTLWHDASDDALVQGLLTAEPTWEKGVYHLLVRYREQCIGKWEMRAEERAKGHLRRSEKRVEGRRQIELIADQVEIAVDQANENGALEPKAKLNGHHHQEPPITTVTPLIIACPPSDESFIHVSAFDNGRPSNIPGFTSSPHAPANTPIIPYIDRPEAASPTVGDELKTNENDFFSQVFEHLESMSRQGKEATLIPDVCSPLVHNFGIRRVSREHSSLSASPPMPLFDPRVPVGWDMEEVGPRSLTAAVDKALFSPVLGTLSPVLAPVDVATAITRKKRPVPLKLASSADDKENQPVTQPNTHLAPSMPTTRPILGDRHIQFAPCQPPERKQPDVPTDIGLPSPALTEHSSAPATPLSLTPTEVDSSERQSWMTNPFKLKPATYELLSTSDAARTSNECRTLLTRMGVDVAPNTGGTIALRCYLPERKDPAGVMGVVREVKFRIEIRAPGGTQAAAGFASVVRLVQEKGALASFKIVFNRLRREWELDTLGR